MADLYCPPPIADVQVEVGQVRYLVHHPGTLSEYPGGGVCNTAAKGRVRYTYFIVTQGDFFLRCGEWVTLSLMQLFKAWARSLTMKPFAMIPFA